MTTTTNALVRERAAGAARGRWLMLIVLLAGQFMALLDVTIVNVAMPTIGRTLHATGAELQLVVAGYTVSYAMALITGARMGDLYGRRRMFLTGVLVFTVASLTCGIAPGIEILIAARFVQGAGAAAMMPQIMSVIQVRFSGAARARALSAYTAVLSSGFVAGQLIGGVLVTANLFGQSWRPVFLVNVPIGLAVLALVPLVMPADEPGPHRRRLDLTGLAIAVPAVFLVVLPLMLGHQEDWPGWVFACLAGGVALAAVFGLVERRIADRGGDPLLNLAVLRAPGLVPGLAAVAVLMITYGGFLFSFALHLQAGLGDSALRAGLTFAPCAVVFGLCGYFWRRLPSGLHHLIAPLGCLVAVGGYAWVALVLHSGGQGGPVLQLALVVTGAALALGFSPLVTHALVRVPLAQAADASGLLTTTIQLGQAVGVAAFGSLFLTLDSAPGPAVSGHALAVTFGWLAAAMVLGVAAGIPLARTVAAARGPAASGSPLTHHGAHKHHRAGPHRATGTTPMPHRRGRDHHRVTPSWFGAPARRPVPPRQRRGVPRPVAAGPGR
ncbi:MAG TPA: MFS transporter [Streptosporangiaceae bacterium]|nr:MFS transporter [Streptosporangiaceae bacterium]